MEYEIQTTSIKNLYVGPHMDGSILLYQITYYSIEYKIEISVCFLRKIPQAAILRWKVCVLFLHVICMYMQDQYVENRPACI